MLDAQLARDAQRRPSNYRLVPRCHCSHTDRPTTVRSQAHHRPYNFAVAILGTVGGASADNPGQPIVLMVQCVNDCPSAVQLLAVATDGVV